jgi:hypothetical protein
MGLCDCLNDGRRGIIVGRRAALGNRFEDDASPGAVEDAMPEGHGQNNLAGKDIGLKSKYRSLFGGWNERWQREIGMNWECAKNVHRGQCA